MLSFLQNDTPGIDYNFYDKNLLYLTKFNQNNVETDININRLLLNLSFKYVGFNKKKYIHLLLLLELLSNQKVLFIRSRKINMRLNTKKGTIVSGQITMRNKNLLLFQESMQIAELYTENNVEVSLKKIKKNITNVFFATMQNLYSFPQISREYNENFKKININWIFTSKAFEEKCFSASIFKIHFVI